MRTNKMPHATQGGLPGARSLEMTRDGAPRFKLVGGDSLKGREPLGPGHAGGARFKGSGVLFACLFVAVAVFMALAAVLIAPFDARASQDIPASITVERHYYLNEGGGSNDAFLDTATGETMYCANVEMHAPSTGTVFTGGYQLNDPMVDYILYHGYDGPVADFYSDDEAVRLASYDEPWATVDGRTYSRWGVFQGTRNAIWIARGTSSLYSEQDPRFRETDNDTWAYTRYIYNSAKAWVAAGAKGPENGYAIFWPSPDGGTTQAMISQGKKAGSLALEKRCKDPEAVSGIELYSLEGAVYGVYSDNACSEELGRMTTDSEGKARLDSVPGGTYYVKELTPSAGMMLDASVHEVDVAPGKTASVTSIEKPLFDTPEYWVAKMDAATGLLVPQGNGSLGGAKFTVEYFPNMSGSFAGEPMRTWTVTTDESGRASLANASAVAGDALFRDAAGKVVLPLGSYRVTEVAPPRGYKLTQKTAAALVEGENGELTAGYITPIISEVIEEGTGVVAKVDADFHKGAAQGSATLAGAEISIYNQSSHAVVVDGESYEPGELVCVLTTREDGSSPVSPALPFGSYTARETAAPEGYLVNEEWSFSFDISRDGQQLAIELSDTVKRGGGRIDKRDFDSDANLPQGDATLAGAELAIFNANEQPVVVNGTEFAPSEQIECLLITDEGGQASTASSLLPYGSYIVRESKAPRGYLVNSSWEATVTITEQGKVVDAAEPLHDEVIRGGVRINKIDAERDEAVAQGAATLAGAKVAIYNTSACGVRVGESWILPASGETREELLSSTPAIVLATDASGRAQSAADALPYGSYVAIEVEPSRGYLLNTAWQQRFSIGEEGQMAEVDPLPQDVLRGGVVLAKVDAETSANLPLGEGMLSGARFEIVNEGAEAVMVEGALVQPGEVALTLTTNEQGIAISKADALPFGRYSYQETANPYGYLPVPGGAGSFEIERDGVLVNAANSEPVEVDEAGMPIDASALAPAAANQVIRGELHFNKLDFATQREIANCAFKITALATGESHIVVTDENGVFDSAYFEQGMRDNANDAAYTVLQAASGVALGENGEEIDLGSWERGEVDSSLLDSKHGVWFSGQGDGQGGQLDEKLSSFPVGSYRIDELRCAANEGLQLITNRRFTVYASEKLANETYDLGTFNNLEEPRIGTSLAGQSGEKRIEPQEAVTLVDTIAFENLTPGNAYLVKGWLHTVEDGTGGSVVAFAETSFTPATASGTTQVSFTFDASSLDGTSLVAFERLFDLDSETPDTSVATHEDPSDPAQTVTFEDGRVPQIKTTLTDESGTKLLPSSGAVQLVDTVSYSGLKPGAEYLMRGALQLVKADGSHSALEDCSAQTSLTASESGSGTVVVEFSLAVDKLDGIALVAFEELGVLRADGSFELVAEHADIKDESQTVWLSEPDLATMLASIDGEKSISYADDIVLIDTIRYEGLTVDSTYIITGSLIDTATGDALLNRAGEPITASTQLVPKTTGGICEVRFELAGDILAGKTVVAFESLAKDGVEIAAHRDLDSAAQTISVDKPTPPSTEKQTPKQGKTVRVLAKTGDEFDGRPIAALCIGSAGALALAVVARRIKRRPA